MKKDRYVGIAMAGIGIIMFFLTKQIAVSALVASGDIGSRFFPYLASVGLTICGIATAVSAAGGENEAFMPSGGWKRIALMTVVLLAYVLGLQYLGFLVSSPVLMYIMVTLLAGDEKIHFLPKAIFSVVMTGAVYAFFVYGVSILLPKGIIFS